MKRVVCRLRIANIHSFHRDRPMPSSPWIFVPTPRAGEADDVPGFRVKPRQTNADAVPGFRVNPDGSTRDDGAEPVPVSLRPQVPLPKMEGNPGPSLHPPGRWWRRAPGFPWEWIPDLPPLPAPPPFVPPRFLPFPYQPSPSEPRSPEPGRDEPWWLLPPKQP